MEYPMQTTNRRGMTVMVKQRLIAAIKGLQSRPEIKVMSVNHRNARKRVTARKIG
jgi:uncharacterized protein YhbP (UPF0306 family)